MTNKRAGFFAALRALWGRPTRANADTAVKSKPLVVVGRVTGIERSIIPEHVVFRGLGADEWGILDGRESPLTITGYSWDERDRVIDGLEDQQFRGGEEYSALVDLKRHPVNRGDIVVATLESARLRSVGMTVLLVTDLRPFRSSRA